MAPASMTKLCVVEEPLDVSGDRADGDFPRGLSRASWRALTC